MFNLFHQRLHHVGHCSCKLIYRYMYIMNTSRAFCTLIVAKLRRTIRNVIYFRRPNSLNHKYQQKHAITRKWLYRFSRLLEGLRTYFAIAISCAPDFVLTCLTSLKWHKAKCTLSGEWNAQFHLIPWWGFVSLCACGNGWI